MWFTETAWPPILVGCVIAGLFVAAWYSSRRALPLIGALVVLALCVGIYVAERTIITEAEKIEQAVVDLTHAFRQKEVERTKGFFSPRYEEGRELVTRVIHFVDVEDDLSIASLNVRMLASNSRAESDFYANATVGTTTTGNLGRQSSRWKLTWQREGGEWKIIQVRRLNPINGTEMAIQGFN